jgi:hypothetical protein
MSGRNAPEVQRFTASSIQSNYLNNLQNVGTLGQHSRNQSNQMFIVNNYNSTDTERASNFNNIQEPSTSIEYNNYQPGIGISHNMIGTS